MWPAAREGPWEQGWRIFDPIIRHAGLRAGIAEYAQGSWGPAAADALMGAGDDAGVGTGSIKRAWHNPVSTEVR